MADRKITDLTALAAGSQATGDLLTIVDVSESAAADKNKKITVESLFKGIPGNVGIGNTSPASGLDIRPGVTGAINAITMGYGRSANPTDAIHKIRWASDDLIIEADSANTIASSIQFRNDGTERLRIDSSGRVGIGDSSPDFDLVIKGGSNTNENLFACKDSDGTKMVSVEQDSSGNGRLLVFDTSGNNDVLLHTSGNSFFNGGNVGIGTSSPAAKLDVNGNVQFGDGGGFDMNINGTRHQFSVGGSEKMRLTSDGELGIGTTSPNAALTVHSSAGNAKIRLGQGGDHTIIGPDSSGHTIINAGTSGGTMNFQTAGTERMRIDSSGRVGIGETSMDGLLVIKGDSNASSMPSIRLKDGTDSREAWISNASGDLVLVNGGTDNVPHCKITMFDGNIISFETANSERMRITSAGRLKVSNTAGSGSVYYTNVNFSTFHTNTGGNIILGLENSASSDPYGVAMNFSDAAPDNNSNYFLYCTDESAVRCVIYSDGDIQNHDNSYSAISDVKLKQDIVDAGSQWEDLKNLRVRKFKFKSDVTAYGDDAKTLIGLVAQEAETVSPGLVADNPDKDSANNDLGTTTKSIRYSVLYMKAVKALQEAQARIETLESQQADLLARVTALEAS